MGLTAGLARRLKGAASERRGAASEARGAPHVQLGGIDGKYASAGATLPAAAAPGVRAGRVLGLLLACVALVLVQAGLAEGSASADATVEPAPSPGAPGLPDGRVYEEASPANKHGSEVKPQVPTYASADGQAVFYHGDGSLAETSSGSIYEPVFVSERGPRGWTTRSAMPLPIEGNTWSEEFIYLLTQPTLAAPSEDLSHIIFGTWGKVPFVGAPDNERGYQNNVYIGGPNPLVEPEWLGRSLLPGKPAGEGATKFSKFLVAGASADLKTVYFYYEAPLMSGSPSGLYEYREGTLSDAGVLPHGETGSGKATPVAESTSAKFSSVEYTAPDGFDNQVSKDGSRVFFVRDDEAGTRELYMHVAETSGSRTELITGSQLPGHEGEPSADGPVAMPSTAAIASEIFNPEGPEAESQPSYAYASPEGEQVFFQSVDRLTADAPEDATAKTYDFDVEAGTLEYVPGIVGSIVAVSNGGSSAIFENNTMSPYELERWVAGEHGGSVTPIAPLPSPAVNYCGEVICVGPAYVSNDGEIVTFATPSPMPGFNDGGTHYPRQRPEEGEASETGKPSVPNQEIFRYDAERNEISCLSCPPSGTAPASDALMSKPTVTANGRGVTGGVEAIAPGRAMSSNGDRVFFETRDALIPQDVNGTSDVYEWENGEVHLISSGHEALASKLAGVSESGNDAFFMTAEHIAPGDTDGGYDVYDARVPRPGDVIPPEALPCSGDVCQGPPSVPQLLGPPASETFNGLGNVQQTTVKQRKVRKVTHKGKPKRCKRRRRHRGGGRVVCKRKARHKRSRGKALRRHGRNRDLQRRGN